MLEQNILIHSADPQSRPVVIIVFIHVVRTCVRPHFSKSTKTNQISLLLARLCGLAESTIDDT